jgi:hypothetical protein
MAPVPATKGDKENRMNQPRDGQGRVLSAALQEQPSLVLSFFSYGIVLQKQTGQGLSEYPVDPEQVALALSARVGFNTGLLSGDSLLIRSEGVQKTVVEYRRGQKTGLWLEGSEAPIRVPLPPLLLIRTTTENSDPRYRLYAVKRRPASLDVALYHAPLPNIYLSGSICWGSVQRVSDQALSGSSLADDWQRLLGTRFGDHSVSGKSKQFPEDIRQAFIALEQRQARVYRKSDLIPVRRTLAQELERGR